MANLGKRSRVAKVSLRLPKFYHILLWNLFLELTTLAGANTIVKTTFINMS